MVTQWLHLISCEKSMCHDDGIEVVGTIREGLKLKLDDGGSDKVEMSGKEVVRETAASFEVVASLPPEARLIPAEASRDPPPISLVARYR